MDYLKNIWEIKIQVIPVMLLLIIYILPNEIRKYKHLRYAPIYFAVPPFCNSNILIDRYYEFIYPNNILINEEENKEKILKEIKKSAGMSLALEACIWPIIFGSVSGIIISSDILNQLLVFILLLRLYQFTKSILDFRSEHYYDKISAIILIGIYICFSYFSIDYIYKSHNWISNAIIRKEYLSIFHDIIGFISKDLILGGSIMYVGKNIFINSLLNKEIDEYGSVYHIQNTYSENEDENNHVN